MVSQEVDREKTCKGQRQCTKDESLPSGSMALAFFRPITVRSGTGLLVVLRATTWYRCSLGLCFFS